MGGRMLVKRVEGKKCFRWKNVREIYTVSQFCFVIVESITTKRRHGKVAGAYFLALEDVRDGFDGFLLILQVWVELDFHFLIFLIRCIYLSNSKVNT